MGFAFPDYATVWKAMDGARRPCAPADREGGPRRHGEDLGQRVPPDDVVDEADQHAGRPPRHEAPRAGPALDLDVQGLPGRADLDQFNEVYTALQTKVVDGQENPAIIATAKLNEVQKYCSLTNHMWDGFWFLANRRAWERLPENLRAVVAAHQRRSREGARGRRQAQRLASAGACREGHGLQPAVPAPFRKLRQAGFYAEWKGKYGDEAWAILERSTGKLS